MSKRASQFPRKARDFYPTPPEAVEPLKAHLPRGARYWEPCCGDGALIRALDGHAQCVAASDIEVHVETGIARSVHGITSMQVDQALADYFITNPPWPRPGCHGEPVLGIVEHLSAMRRTWLLLPFDIAANRYFRKVSSQCVKIVPIGRVSWEQNGTAGKDNAAWFLFDARHVGHTVIHARAA